MLHNRVVCLRPFAPFICGENNSSVTACPHAGFNSPKTQAGDLARESIDCRAFVLYADLKEYPREVGKLFEGIHGHMV
jgi:hypothetical protein